MNLARFPRRRYTQGQTPIEKLSWLSDMLGGPTLFMKRDDLLSLTAGGNKTRKLEFLVRGFEKPRDREVQTPGSGSRLWFIATIFAFFRKVTYFLKFTTGHFREACLI